MSWRQRAVHAAQALAVYMAFAVARGLPLDAASALGGWLGRHIGPRIGISRRAARNLGRAFPEKTDGEIDTIVGAMWDNLGRTAFEYPHLGALRFGGADAHVQVIGGEHVDQLRDDGRAGMFFAAHLANWEIAALGVTQRGVPVHLVHRALNNPWIERLFYRGHAGRGRLIPKGAQGARQSLRLLADGGHIGMLVDQKMNDGIPVAFFGRQAMTAPALAQFALRFDCPVLATRVERLGGARFRITHFAPLAVSDTGDRHADVARFMARVNGMIEDWVRERPEQWLWLHKRWPD